MKKHLLKSLALIFVGISIFQNQSSAQCTGGTPGGTIVPTTSIQLQTIPSLTTYYDFTASMGFTYMFTFCPAYGGDAGASSYDTQLTVNDNLGNYAGGYNDDFCGLQSYLEWICPANGNYEILASLFNCNTSATSSTIMAYQIIPPANDPCTNATPIAVPSTVINNTTLAASESTLPCGTTDGTGGGVWYTVVGDGNQYTASTCTGTAFDTRIRVYTGSCSSLTCEAGNDDFCSTQSSVTWCSVAGTTYYILVHGNGASVGAFTLNMSEVAVVPPGITQSAPAYCATGSVNIDATGYATYNWSPPTGLNTTTGPSVIASPSSTTTYTVQVTDVGTGCPAYANATVTVYALPIVTSSASSPTVCSGSPTSLSATGATSYTWDPGSVPGNPVTVNPLVTTTYTVTGTDGNGCIDTNTVMVNVNALPPVDATSAAPSVCIGSFVTMNAAGAITYNWMPGNLTGNTVSVNPSSTTTYTLTGTDGNGCVNTDSLTMIVNPLPTITATATPDTVCTGNVDTLTAAGGVSYVWSNGPTTNPEYVSPNTMTTYTVTGTDANGCVNSGTVTVYALLSGPVTATADYPAICTGSSDILNVIGAPSYTWMPGNLSGSQVTVTPAATTTYTVTGYSTNGCIKTDTLTVTVNPLPAVTGSASIYAFCGGSPSTLTGSGASTYTWDPGNISGNPVTVNPTSSTTYTATGTDANGCMDTALVSLTVLPPPNVSASAAPPVSCSGNPVTITASGATTYNWQPGSLTGTSVTVSPATATTYTVTGTDPNGCTNSFPINIAVVSPANLIVYSSETSVCANDMIVYLYGVPGGGTWSGVGVSGNVFTPSVAGPGTHVCTYTYLDQYGCTTTATTSIFVNACVGINEQIGLNGVSFYPNPNDGTFTVNVASSDISEMKMEIIDLQGRIVYAEILNGISSGFAKTINMLDVADGAYYVRFTSNNNSTTQKLIISR